MPRHIKPRTIGYLPENRLFLPQRPNEAVVYLSLVEVESMRLADHEGFDQDTAAQQMKISRGTFQRIVNAARQKVIDALLHGKVIKIEGGEYEYCPGRGHGHGCGAGRGCGRRHRGGRG